MGYQSFPWARGDSASYQKLHALAIPALKNRTFLDVGCNEGYFCGYAEFIGAKKVTGIDRNPNFIEMAKCLFPNCEFLCQDWTDPLDAKYDVILNASAIHYAEDQKQFLDLLMSRLAPNGTLILETGVAPGDDNRFVEVKRSIDTRLFPTRAKLLEMLEGYAFKYISRSVPQAGDPIPREVYHISHKLPYAILALDNPHAGKTFTIRRILKPEIRVISGDMLYYQVAHGQLEAPGPLQEIINENSRLNDWGHVTRQICKNRQFPLLCSWIASLACHQDFILDMYIPSVARNFLAESLEKDGYYVVGLLLQKAISRPRKREMAPHDSCYRYLRHLQAEFMINEADYLEANPDVAQALKEGKITSSLAHYIFHGRKEGRKRSLADGKNQA